jgi:hypothetical protein
MRAIHARIAQVLILAVVAGLWLLGTATFALQAMPGSPALCDSKPGTASGGVYQLVSVAWHVTGTSSGGDYRLLGPAAPALRGSGCCCTYMPLALRNCP